MTDNARKVSGDLAMMDAINTGEDLKMRVLIVEETPWATTRHRVQAPMGLGDGVAPLWGYRIEATAPENPGALVLLDIREADDEDRDKVEEAGENPEDPEEKQEQREIAVESGGMPEKGPTAGGAAAMLPTGTEDKQWGRCTDCGQPVNPPELLRCRPCAAVHDPNTPAPWRHVHANLSCEDCGAPRPEFHWQCWNCAREDIKG